MLQNLREHAQGWVAGVIVGIFCLAFGLWGIEYYLESNRATDSVVKVNGETITNQQLDAAVQRLRQDLILTNPSLNLDQNALKTLRDKALEQLINRQVLSDAAIKAGYRIGYEQLDSVILQVPTFQVNGRFSPELFQRVLTNLLYSQSEFMHNLQQNMLIIQAQTSMTESEFALSKEVDQLIKLLQQKRDFTYSIIPAKKDPAQIKVNEEAINNYYQQHQNEFMLPEQVSIAYLMLSAKDLAQQIKAPSDQELLQYYQTNQQQFTRSQQWQIARILLNAGNDEQTKVKTKELANHIIVQAQSGANFAQLVKKYSTDKATLSQGGVMPWIVRNQKNAVLVQELTKLKPGQITLIETPEGINIVKLIAVKTPSMQSFDESKAQISQLLKQQRLEQIFNEKNDQLANLTFTNPDTLEPAARALNLPIKTTEFFTQKGAKTGLASNSKVITAAFSDTVLKQSSNSDVIQLDPETLIVLRVKEHKAAKLAPLAEVKPQIQQQLISELAQKQAEKTGQLIISSLKSGKNPAELAKTYGLIWQNVNNVMRQSPGLNSQVLNIAFGAPKPDKSKPTIVGTQLANGDYAVIAISQVTEGDPKLTSQQERASIEKSIAVDYGQLENQLYIQEQLKQAKIKSNKN